MLINTIIDQYWNKEKSEEEMVNKIGTIFANNESLIIKEGSFTTTLKQICGKRRLEIVSKIIDL